MVFAAPAMAQSTPTVPPEYPHLPPDPPQDWSICYSNPQTNYLDHCEYWTYRESTTEERVASSTIETRTYAATQACQLGNGNSPRQGEQGVSVTEEVLVEQVGVVRTDHWDVRWVQYGSGGLLMYQTNFYDVTTERVVDTYTQETVLSSTSTPTSRCMPAPARP
jgi:hypothetical protein